MLSLEQVDKLLNFWNFPSDPAQYWHLGKIGGVTMNVNPKTMVLTWITMLLVLLFCWAATRKLELRKPGKLQSSFEMLWEFIRSQVFDNTGDKKGATMVSLVFTFFIFIFFANLMGLVPTLSSPTADLNTTLGLAIFVLVLTYYFGIKYKGMHHFAHFFKPFIPFVFINIIEEVAKPVTLAFRLYGNIFAGEVLVAVLLGLLLPHTYFFGGFIPSVIWLAFSVFVGLIQAFIFTMLTIAYISQVVSDEH